jgi:hypothetical protein
MKNELENAVRQAFAAGLSWSDFLATHSGRVIVLSAPARERLLAIVVSGEPPVRSFDELAPPPAALPDTFTRACFRGIQEVDAAC